MPEVTEIKTLDRYLLKELFVPFLIGTLMVVLMFSANTYMGLARELQLDNVPVSAIYQVIFYQTPLYLNMTLPIGMSLATSLAMSRIARESELTAMRAAGVPILRVLMPIALFGVLVSGFHFYDIEVLMPPSMKKASNLLAKVAGYGFTPTMATNKLINLGRYSASLGLVSRTGDSMDLAIKSVLLIDRPDTNTTNLTTAESATYKNGVWSFKNAYLDVIKGEDIWIAHPLKDFVINEPIRPEDMFAQTPPEEMSIKELQEGIKSSVSTGADVHRYQLSLYDKFFVPLSCFVFSFVSPMFAILFARSGGFAGVLLSFVMALAYYNLYVICSKILGKMGALPPMFVSALPDLLFIALGLWAVRKLE
jgi:lipopolysaccharide export system permease protein